MREETLQDDQVICPVQLAWGMQHDATDDPVDVTNIVIVIRPIAAARLLLARTKVRAALTVMRNLEGAIFSVVRVGPTNFAVEGDACSFPRRT